MDIVGENCVKCLIFGVKIQIWHDYCKCLLFEYHQKCLIWIFQFMAFSNNFLVPFRIDLSGNTVLVFQKLAKLAIFGNFFTLNI